MSAHYKKIEKQKEKINANIDQILLNFLSGDSPHIASQKCGIRFESHRKLILDNKDFFRLYKDYLKYRKKEYILNEKTKDINL